MRSTALPLLRHFLAPSEYPIVRYLDHLDWRAPFHGLPQSTPHLAIADQDPQSTGHRAQHPQATVTPYPVLRFPRHVHPMLLTDAPCQARFCRQRPPVIKAVRHHTKSTQECVDRILRARFPQQLGDTHIASGHDHPHRLPERNQWTIQEHVGRFSKGCSKLTGGKWRNLGIASHISSSQTEQSLQAFDFDPRVGRIVG